MVPGTKNSPGRESRDLYRDSNGGDTQNIRMHEMRAQRWNKEEVPMGYIEST